MNETQQNRTNKLIDLDHVFKTRNPKLYRLIPKFVINYLKRIIHQEELNEFMSKCGHLNGLAFVNAGVRYANVDLEILGEDNLSIDKRYIFTSNHPLGGLDGVMLLDFIGHKFGEAKAVVNDLLLAVENFKPVFVGINSYGSNAKKNLQNLNDAFETNAQIIFFPAGLVSRKVKGVVQDLTWKKTAVVRAIRHKLDIVPTFVSGRNSDFFYNFANFRKKIGIKFNIELIFLPDEMFKHRGKHFKIIVGEPIPYHTFDKLHTPDEWAEKLRQFIYILEKNPKASFTNFVKS